MHYEDEDWIRKNNLSVVIYKRKDLRDDKFYYDLCSIYESKHIHPFSLVKFIYSFEFMFSSELELLEEERFYFLDLKQNDFDNFILKSIKDVTNSPNKFMQLH